MKAGGWWSCARPGRVNLIGEHTDYNDGFVFPMAIQPQVSFVCRGREDGLVRVTSTAFPDEMVEFSIQTAITKAQPTWANYVRGVASELKKAGIPLIGMDVQLSNTLPVGGGLSSSAAIEVGTALCFLAWRVWRWTWRGWRFCVSRPSTISPMSPAGSWTR